ncbi:MAG TPA: hypothetical protein VGI57_13060, partial [Usitatibacter sp.]
PVSLGDDGLLIWFAPFAGGAMNAVEGPKHSTYNNNFINLPNRAWYPRLGNWEAGTALAFTTVLVAHRPDENVKDLAAGISVAADDASATVLRIKLRGQEYVVAMNAPGHEVTSSSFRSSAEAAVLREGAGGNSFASWGGGESFLDGKRLVGN